MAELCQEPFRGAWVLKYTRSIPAEVCSNSKLWLEELA